ncbi:MAG: M24 family metallopeptidase [Acidimicrobiales bacterium]
MASEEGARLDLTRLREDRRRRLLDAMSTEGLDVLILGRPANVRYASGARQLWTAGTRPFAPACVVVGEGAEVHLLSVWDEGIPPDIPQSHLFGLSWDPANLMDSLGAIPGLTNATRVGTDALTPTFLQLFPAVAPRATILDGRTAIRRARESKTEDEVACIATATAVAEAGLSALVEALRPGVSERHLLGIFAERVGQLGAPILAQEGVAVSTPAEGAVRLRQAPSERPVGIGELVVLNGGVMYCGYEGGLGRTWSAGPGEISIAQRSLGERCRAGLRALIGECREGRTGADLKAAWAATGEPMPPIPLVHGMGLGAEPPVIGVGRGDDAVLRAMSVLSVQSWVSCEGAGGFLERELVLVTAEGQAPRLLSRFDHGPAS